MSAKRLFDLALALPGLLLSVPIFFFLAIIIKLDSPGPVFFRQTRIGRFGRPFVILKFRTMKNGADRSGPKITAENDVRITRVGHVLRRTKLDELPQLFNVIRGQMSLVGPRPEVPEYVDKYRADVRKKILSIRPGITDEASIMFRHESQILSASTDPNRLYVHEILPKKLRMHEKYVDNHTIRGDIAILLRSLGAILFG